MSYTYVDISIIQSPRMENHCKIFLEVYTPYKLIASVQGYDMNVYISFDSISIEKTLFQNLIPLPKQKVEITLKLFNKKTIKLKRIKEVYLLSSYALFKQKTRYPDYGDYGTKCLYSFHYEEGKFIDNQTGNVDSM